MVRNSEVLEAIELFPLLEKDIANLKDMQVCPATRKASVKRVMAAIIGTMNGHQEIKEKLVQAGLKLQDIRNELSKIQPQIESLGGPYSVTSSGRVSLNASNDTTTGLVKLWYQKEDLTKKAENIEKLHDEWTKKVLAETKAMKALIEFLELLHPERVAWPPGTYQGSDVVIDVPQFMGHPDPDDMLQATYNAVLAAWKQMKDQLGLNDYLR